MEKLSLIKLEEKICKDFKVSSLDKLNKDDFFTLSFKYNLSEEFIEKYKNKVNWNYISIWQKLSKEFIEKYQDMVNWGCISIYQKLLEPFIEKYKDKVNWYYISKHQKLSEPFIKKYKDKVNWYYISKHQKLSEPFIEKHQNKLNLNIIAKYQKLSKEFIEKHKIKIDKNNWLYKDEEFKKKKIIKCGLYECYDNYFIAYKGIRSNNYSCYNFQYKYEVGGIYDCHADHTAEENSFGLSAWTYEKAKEYCNEKIIKVKIYYKDVARLVHNDNKIRCTRFEVLEEVE